MTTVGEHVTIETTDGHTLRGRVTYLSPDTIRLVSPAGMWNVRRDAVATLIGK